MYICVSNVSIYNMLKIMQDRDNRYQSQLSDKTKIREYEIRYKGSICPPTCIPIGTLSSRESIVLTNMTRLINLMYEELKTVETSIVQPCSLETLYDFFENTPSHNNDIENPIFQSFMEIMDSQVQKNKILTDES